MNIPEEFSKEAFDKKAAEFRYVIADMMCRAGSGHLGGCYSIIEILITLYWRILNIDPNNKKWADRDRFVLSKGHAGPALYATLAFRGYFPPAELVTLNQNGTNLPSHCDMIKTPGVDMTAGSLGQGLSAAVGMALAGKMDKKSYTVYSIIGDGESNEGQIWEAALFAAHKKLDNLVVITDYNKFQIDGAVKDILGLDSLVEKWRAFNWDVYEIDGHNWDEIYNTLVKAKAATGKPKMIIAHTIKGKGHPKYANTCDSHNLKIADAKTADELRKTMAVEGFVWP